MPYTLKIGSLKCHILSDGVEAADGGGFFGLVPRVMWEKVIAPNELNQVPAALRVLLIESQAGLILVDTGRGDKFDEKQRNILRLGPRRERLVSDLRRVGFRPEEVAIVILTHLHADHAGGATQLDVSSPTRWDTPDHSPGKAIATFPKAKYFVQRLDLAEASFPNERTLATYQSYNWQPLLESGQLEIINGDYQIAPGVRTEVAPGHTISIQSVWVEDRGESLLFLGDASSWAIHLTRLPWVPSYDIYPMTSIESKRRLQREALAKNALLVFQHDGQVVTGRLIEGKRGPEVQPEITETAWFDASA
ncbi:hypothetical protein DCC62_25600 [candidate division KSB1 bacterium]|nr:MAG: hypothetical protein DCC62_25600 [candidate division KSB1 bacterium]